MKFSELKLGDRAKIDYIGDVEYSFIGEVKNYNKELRLVNENGDITYQISERFNKKWKVTLLEKAKGDKDRIIELENAIRKHRDQKFDDRCFLDDQELYKVLNEPIPENYNAVPPIETMLKNCKRYLENRCKAGPWKTYEELENENKLLRKELKSKEWNDFI